MTGASIIVKRSGLLACTLLLATFLASAQKEPANNNVPPQLLAMMGSWNVEQRMWTGSGVKATPLPPAVAERRLIGSEFLQEIMEPAAQSNDERFTRIAYLVYNAVKQQYEYCSLDTRAPQMMVERSKDAGGLASTQRNELIKMQGSIFIAPQWGDRRNVAFRYRITVSEVANDHQIVRLYFTPLSGRSSSEFLAFEYVYIRK